MNGLNTLSNTTTKMTNLLDKISTTCNALVSALEMTTESTSQYGGGILEQFDPEFVDKVISLLIQLRLYTTRLHKEILNGLIKNAEDMQLLVGGMQDFSDKLHELMRENGNLRNNFEFAFREIDASIQQIKDEIVLQ